MNYLDWPLESVALHGPPGGLVPIPIPDGASIEESYDDGWVTRRTVSGRVVAQRLPQSRRTWAVKLPALEDSDLLGLAGLRLRKYPDLGAHWITPDMWGNHVDPRWGSFTNVRTPGWDRGSAWVTPEGLHLPATLRALEPGTTPVVVAGTAPTPPDGRGINASAWIAGGVSEAVLQVQWLNAADLVTATHESRPVGGPTPERVDISTAPVDGAVAYRVLVRGATFTAGTQVTWGPELLDYAIPSGCYRAVLVDPGRSLKGISNGNPYRTADFTVVEVG